MDSRLVLPADTVLDGGYRILRVVGAGGFGITYEAEDLSLGTMVAIKEYYPFDFGDRDASMSVRPKSERHKSTFEKGLSNFLQEARTLARFEHASIVRVMRVLEANSTAYMVMRFELGLSFEAWLRSLSRPPTQAELDFVAARLLDALQTMHAADFLHRDIAPDNIVIRADGTPVLLDFGAARRAVAEMSRSLTGIVKAGYSPHEQYSSDGRLQGPWSDIYALGGTLYRAVVGKAPEEATLRFDEDRMLSAAEAGKGKYRPSFLAAIDTCLKVRHAERPQSVAQLRPMLLGVPSLAHGSERLAQASSVPRTSAPPRSGRTAANQRARRWPAVAVLAAVLAGAYGAYEYGRWSASEGRDPAALPRCRPPMPRRAARRLMRWKPRGGSGRQRRRTPTSARSRSRRPGDARSWPRRPRPRHAAKARPKPRSNAALPPSRTHVARSRPRPMRSCERSAGSRLWRRRATPRRSARRRSACGLPLSPTMTNAPNSCARCSWCSSAAAAGTGRSVDAAPMPSPGSTPSSPLPTSAATPHPPASSSPKPPSATSSPWLKDADAAKDVLCVVPTPSPGPVAKTKIEKAQPEREKTKRAPVEKSAVRDVEACLNRCHAAGGNAFIQNRCNRSCRK